jgi:hypothetical protein
LHLRRGRYRSHGISRRRWRILRRLRHHGLGVSHLRRRRRLVHRHRGGRRRSHWSCRVAIARRRRRLGNRLWCRGSKSRSLKHTCIFARLASLGRRRRGRGNGWGRSGGRHRNGRRGRPPEHHCKLPGALLVRRRGRRRTGRCLKPRGYRCCRRSRGRAGGAEHLGEFAGSLLGRARQRRRGLAGRKGGRWGRRRRRGAGSAEHLGEFPRAGFFHRGWRGRNGGLIDFAFARRGEHLRELARPRFLNGWGMNHTRRPRG